MGDEAEYLSNTDEYYDERDHMPRTGPSPKTCRVVYKTRQKNAWTEPLQMPYCSRCGKYIPDLSGNYCCWCGSRIVGGK